MAANRKSTTKNVSELTSIADNIFKSVIQSLKEQDKDVKQVDLDVFQVGHGFRPFGSGALKDDYIDYTIRVNHEELKGLGYNDVGTIGKFLQRRVGEMKNSRLLKNMHTECGTMEIPTYGWHSVTVSFPNKIIAMGEPCKEWNTLCKKIKLFTNQEFDCKDLYSVSLFGKRSSYSESGSRKYACYDSNYCNNILEWLKGNRSCKDKIQFEVCSENDIDTDYSTKYETECYGTKYGFMKVSLFTMGGKLKKQQKFYV